MALHEQPRRPACGRQSRAGRHSGWPLFSLPTHREVVAAAFGLPLWVPLSLAPAPVRPLLRVCVPRRRDWESGKSTRAIVQHESTKPFWFAQSATLFTPQLLLAEQQCDRKRGKYVAQN